MSDLTLFHAMRFLNYVSERKDLVILVIVKNFSEEDTFIKWKILLHLIETVRSLEIIMIGPPLDNKSQISYTFTIVRCERDIFRW